MASEIWEDLYQFFFAALWVICFPCGIWQLARGIWYLCRGDKAKCLTHIRKSVLFFAVTGFSIWWSLTSEYLAIDSCVDRGHRYNFELQQCEDSLGN